MGLVLIAALLLPACGTNRMDMKFSMPPDKTEEQFRQDRYDCIQKHDSEQKFQACLEARGDTRVK
jgi:hypothetical protein